MAPTPANPGELLWIGNSGGQNHFNIGIGQGTSGGTDHDDHSQAEIEAGYSEANRFFLIPDRTAVECRINAGAGKTSSGTKFPRSELREYLLDGTTKAAWNGASGDHWMDFDEEIVEVTQQRPWVCFAQIHDAESDLVRLQTEGSAGQTTGLSIVARYTKDGDETRVVIATGYDVGDRFTGRLRINNGTLTVTLNGSVVLTVTGMGVSGCYFKAGCYLQSNVTNYGESATDEAAVRIYSLVVWHTGYPSPTTPVYTGPDASSGGRLYLTSAAAPWVPGVAQSVWNDGTLAANARALLDAAAGDPTSQGLAETSTTNPYLGLLGQWVSHPATASGELTGTASLCIGREESDTDANMVIALIIWVSVGTSTAVRGTAAGVYGSVEFPISASAGVLLDVALTDVTVSPGDRVIVEIGYRATNAVAESFTGTIFYGGTGADLASGDTDFDHAPWIDIGMSEGLTFEPSASGGLARTRGFLALL